MTQRKRSGNPNAAMNAMKEALMGRVEMVTSSRIAELEEEVEKLRGQVQILDDRHRAEWSRAECAEAQRDRLAEALRGLICFRGSPNEWTPAIDELDRFERECGETIPDDSERTMHPKAGALRAARAALADLEGNDE